ncbi:hypothetical protein EV424DRAFT_1073365 [Suillus variegatus]|nr:hypothetical protein EV424DRAFT_1073365 [Suillus variegatus]
MSLLCVLLIELLCLLSCTISRICIVNLPCVHTRATQVEIIDQEDHGQSPHCVQVYFCCTAYRPGNPFSNTSF